MQPKHNYRRYNCGESTDGLMLGARGPGRCRGVCLCSPRQARPCINMPPSPRHTTNFGGVFSLHKQAVFPQHFTLAPFALAHQIDSAGGDKRAEKRIYSSNNVPSEGRNNGWSSVVDLRQSTEDNRPLDRCSASRARRPGPALILRSRLPKQV